MKKRYQAGGQLSAQKKFFSDYLNSPKYKERLAKQGYSNPDEVIKARQANLADVHYVSMTGDGSWYNRDWNTVVYDADEAKKYGLNLSTIKAHEVAHAAGSIGNPGYIPITNLTLNANEMKEIGARNKIKDAVDHDGRPGEFKADMDALRFRLQQDNLYNPGTQDFNQKLLDKSKGKYNKDPFIKRLFDRANDKDLIYLMNNIAYQDQQQNPLAQKGGAVDIKSILGYAHNSPFRNSPYLDIQTPGGDIDMSNTPIDLLGIDNLGNTKKMKAGNKRQYKFQGNVVREIPMQQGGYTQEDLYNYLMEDDQPSPEEQQQAIVDQEGASQADERQAGAIDEDNEFDLAMQIAMGDMDSNPYEQSNYRATPGSGGNGFRKFASYQEGKQALLTQLELYKTGRTRNPVKSTSTLLQAMSVYAPSSDGNNPQAYAKFIADRLGVSVNTPISALNTEQWAAAIEKMEGNRVGNNPGNIRN